MPYFNFDLVIGEDFKNQGGMILEDPEIAIDKADSLASELRIVRPELRSRGCAVRVTDGNRHEFYRTPVDPIPLAGSPCDAEKTDETLNAGLQQAVLAF